MEDKTHFVIQYKISQQISPDDFELVLKHFLVTKETTIGEIVGWFEDTGSENKWDSKLKKRVKVKPTWFPNMILSKTDE